MGKHRTLVMALSIVGVLMHSGCASIMSGRHADIKLSSNVPSTHVVVRDKRGQEVASVVTPAVVSLKRKDHFIWPAHYTATFDAQGYAPVVVPIDPTLNPWIVGNIVAGGLVGLAVDNVTGAAWMPKHDELCAQLVPIDGTIPAPQIAALPLGMHSSPPPLVQPIAQPISHSAAQPTSYIEPALPFTSSPGLEPRATTGIVERPRAGGAVSVGTDYGF